MADTVLIKTLSCFCCGKASTLPVDIKSYLKWKDGASIQMAFPSMSPGERELLITGTHPECWDRMFKDLDE